MATEIAEKSADPSRRGLITATAILASMIYSIDWTIAAVALPHMQGTFSATQDQIAWVMTSYIVVSAITLPTTGWLSSALGRKRLFLTSIAGFTFFSFLCGAANSLPAEIFFRALQGCFGAFLLPLSQSLMLDSYPREEHSKAMAMWGLGVILGPVVGPTIGGYLTEFYSWRWVFYISVPVGVLAYAGGLAFLPRDKRSDSGVGFDWLGFAALAMCVGSFQLMLDRGERQDWFQSLEIMIEAGLSLLGLYLFLVHALTSRQPLVNLRLMLDRNYSLGLAFAFLYGMLTLPPMILLPPFLSALQGYPVDTVGLLMSPRGLGLMIAMFVLGRIGNRLDPRATLGFGLFAVGISSWFMAGWNLNVAAFEVVWTGVVQGLGAGAMVVPLGVVTFATLAEQHRTEAASMWNLVRSAGSSIGISVAVFIVARMANLVRASMVEHVSPFNPAFGERQHAGLWDLTSATSLARLSAEVTKQSLLIGYVDVFYLTAWAAFLALPLVLLLAKPKT
jgi:MFS transporter, DHA2 family, multidrug resistance protein